MSTDDELESHDTCRRCHRGLTNPISRALGIGPVCRAKIGFKPDEELLEKLKKKFGVEKKSRVRIKVSKKKDKKKIKSLLVYLSVSEL